MRVGLLVCGSPPAQIEEASGTFGDWFRHLCTRYPVELEELGPSDTADECEALIISGSSLSLTEPAPWMEAAMAMVRRAHGKGLPTLGVCFGHQLIAAAAGAAIIRNPKGWEFGTHAITTLPAGQESSLLRHIESPFLAQCAHQDIVDSTTLPPGLEVLATSERCSVQALRWGPMVFGVQFHPEILEPVMRQYLSVRQPQLDEDARRFGDDTRRASALASKVRPAPYSQAIFWNFLSQITSPEVT